MIEELPDPGPRWMVQEIIPDSGQSLEPVSLYFRDPMEAVKSLLSRADLQSSMVFGPCHVWSNDKKESRVYNEICTGDWWWRTQVCRPISYAELCAINSESVIQTQLSVGSTVIPILLGSDKTHLSVFAGNKKAWPLYLSIGNIHSKVRNAPSRHAWILIAYLPVVVFRDNNGDNEARLYHQCVKYVLNPLAEPGRVGIDLIDSVGAVRSCHPLVAAHLADNPEQSLINVVAGRCSTVTTAKYKKLGEPTPEPLRTYKWIMDHIAQACRKVDPTEIAKYHKEALKLGLNGVTEPYWVNLPLYQPELCPAPDILHGLLRFWRDHILKWIQVLVGETELDNRIMVLQHVRGWRSFKTGIKHLSQWTCREDRELQRVILAVIANSPNIDKRVMRSLRAFHDFLYICQYRSHTTVTLGYLENALHIFHATKRVFVLTGARRRTDGTAMPHFRIAKLAAFHMYSRHIREMGSSPQFSTEIVESLHRPMAKNAYRATNHKDYVVQMCRYMDRMERLRYFDGYMSWAGAEMRRRYILTQLGANSPGYQNLAIRINQEEVDAGMTVRSKSRKHGLIFNQTPHQSRQSPIAVVNSYQLHEFPMALTRFVTTNYRRVSPSIRECKLFSK
jgi:hypothetical protein